MPQHALNSGTTYLAADGDAPRPGYDLASISVKALDDCALRRPVSFVKMDIDGAEPLAVRGASKLLAADRPVSLSEVNPS